MEEIFAKPPPVEAIIARVHASATIWLGNQQSSNVVVVKHVSYACFETHTIRQVCVKLPAEDMNIPDRFAGNVDHLQDAKYAQELPPWAAS